MYEASREGLEQAELPALGGEPAATLIQGDARQTTLDDRSIDLVVTSPPYWKKRDYGLDGQIGQESSPAEFVTAIGACLAEWSRVLTSSGSVFLNIGDTYYRRSLAGIPGRIEAAAIDAGWMVRNRIIWAKDGGMPEPASNRLANRHEYVIHLVRRSDYFYDLLAYAERFGNGANPGDVWQFNPGRHMGRHLAPFPTEIVERAVVLACPEQACSACGEPRRRIVRRTAELDASRPQAKRAMELAKEKRLTEAHIMAIQATGVSDAGKALRFQNGTGRNSAEVKRLAAEAKEALGGYFREFTFARKRTVGWTGCGCDAPPRRGVVLDPFAGTGTTLRAATSLGRDAVGIDLASSSSLPDVAALALSSCVELGPDTRDLLDGSRQRSNLPIYLSDTDREVNTARMDTSAVATYDVSDLWVRLGVDE